MMSTRCEARLSTCCRDLQRVVRRVHRERMALLVLCGHRGEDEQNDAFARKASKLPWPKSRHNSLPAEAVDLAPDPLDWDDAARFRELARHMLEIAAEEGVHLVWGGSWAMQDLVHFELGK